MKFVNGQWVGDPPASRLHEILESGQAPSGKVAEDWAAENGGKGRYIGQMADKVNDPNAYFTDKQSLTDAAHKRGFDTEPIG